MKTMRLKTRILLLAALLAWVSFSASAQTTETFETEAGGSLSFTDNGQVFNITSQQRGPFDIQVNYPGTGWNGSAADNRYIDNDTFAVGGFGTEFTISSSGAVPFRINSMWFYLANSANNLNVSGTLTIVGKLGGATLFTATRTSPFNNTNVGVANGFTLIDMTTFGGANNSLTNIDQLVFTTTNAFNYVALDAFRWSVPPAAPEVNVRGNGVSIVDGDATPSAADHTDFGAAGICSGTVVRTFTIENTGNASLTLSSPTFSGTNAADFSLTSLPGSPVGASGSTTFQVTFNPSAAGLRTATVSFTNNDSDESPYDFAILGTGVDPEANVQGNGTTIADGDATPSAADHTDFGSQSVCSGTIVRTFTIQNSGTANLTLTNPTISGTNAADFSLTATPATPVAPAGSTTFQITFNPSATGVRSAAISFVNNDCDENPYNFSILGAGVDPEVNVQGNGVSIADGDSTPSATDHTDFGSQAVCAGTIIRTFTIQNTGTAILNLTTPTLTGPNAADFSVTANPAGSVAAAGSTTFQVTFNPSAAGLRSADVTFTCSDCDEASYNFSLLGTGVNVPITITASAGPGGSISPSGAVPVACAANQSFTITPGACAATTDVLVDSVSVGAVPSYTFTNVTANHTIAASFVPLAPPSIAALAGAGGSLTPAGVNLAACSVGAVPDRPSLGTPFTLAKNGGNPAHLNFSWGDSCGAGQSDFALFEGVIGSWYSHAARLCSTGGLLSATDVTPAAGNAYYLIVPTSVFAEGSYGTNSSGAEIPQGTGACFGARDLRPCG